MDVRSQVILITSNGLNKFTVHPAVLFSFALTSFSLYVGEKQAMCRWTVYRLDLPLLSGKARQTSCPTFIHGLLWCSDWHFIEAYSCDGFSGFGVVWGGAHNLLYIVNGDNQGSGSSWQYPSQDSSLKRQWESWKSHDLIPCNKDKFVSRVKTGLNIGIQCAHHKRINLSNWGCVKEHSIRLFQREAEAGWQLEIEHR